jgi:hypothetical protein
VNVLQPENFEKILNLFYAHSDQLTHAKIATFIYEVLQSSKAKSLLEYYLDVKNLRVDCLGLISFAMNYFSTIPVDIYPYAISIQQLVSKVFYLKTFICLFAVNYIVYYVVNMFVDYCVSRV